LISSGVKNLDVSRSLVGGVLHTANRQQCSAVHHSCAAQCAIWHKQCRTSAALLWCRPRSL
jgi:hypothetical protein